MPNTQTTTQPSVPDDIAWKIAETSRMHRSHIDGTLNVGFDPSMSPEEELKGTKLWLRSYHDTDEHGNYLERLVHRDNRNDYFQIERLKSSVAILEAVPEARKMRAKDADEQKRYDAMSESSRWWDDKLSAYRLVHEREVESEIAFRTKLYEKMAKDISPSFAAGQVEKTYQQTLGDNMLDSDKLHKKIKLEITDPYYTASAEPSNNESLGTLTPSPRFAAKASAGKTPILIS